MKYIVIELQMNEEGHLSTITTEHASENEGWSKYHSILAVAATSTIPKHSAILSSEEGFVVASKCFKH